MQNQSEILPPPPETSGRIKANHEQRQAINKKQHLPESSSGRILQNEVKENSSRYWGGVRADVELEWRIRICLNLMIR